MKDTARNKDRRQEWTTEQLAFAAIADARATLHDAIVGAGMTVLGALLEEERTNICGRVTRTCPVASRRVRATPSASSPWEDVAFAFVDLACAMSMVTR